MKRKIIFILILLIVLFFNVQLIINLLLNITYSVREIPYTKRTEGLEGITEIILKDYNNFILTIIVDLLLLISLTIYIIKSKIPR